MTDEIDHDQISDDIFVSTYLELKVQHQPRRFLCPYGCNKLIASRTVDYHKNNGCGRRHNDTISHPELKKRFHYCGSCSSEFVTRNEFHDHLIHVHNVHPEIHNLKFNDRQAFDHFKYWLESKGGAHFRHKSGSKRRARGKGIFLACNRSGNVNSDKDASERTGPVRLGFTCTAYIHATEHTDGSVTAEFCGDHYDHDAKMRLPNVIKYFIAQKQMEQRTPMEIIGFLRHHFLAAAANNFYAQRICFVDSDELKTILASSTKKWSREGIPKTVEFWEEELLEKVGLNWPPSSLRLPAYVQGREATTAALAERYDWPRPRVFSSENRRDDDVLVPFEMQEGGQPSNQNEYEQEEEDMADDRYISIELEEDYGVNGFVQGEQLVVRKEQEVREAVVTQNYQEHQGIINKGDEILDDGEIDVEVENEVVVTTVDANNRVIDEPKSCVEEHIVIESPNNEIVIVDEDVEDEIEEHVLRHAHQRQQHHRHERMHPQELELDNSNQAGPSSIVVERYIEVNKASTLEQIMAEIESFKHTILKRAENTSPANLKALLIRFQTLHSSIMDKDQLEAANQSMTVFTHRAKDFYRPGKGLEKPDQEYLQRSTGDVSLQPIDDEISDDEELLKANETVMQYNAGIWS